MKELLPAQLRDLLTAISDHPDDPVRVILSGPPGHGKSTVLGAIGRHYRDAGVRVIGRDSLTGTTSTTGAAVLLDDADLLTGRAREAITRLAGETTRLVLTHTPGTAGTVAAELVRPETRHIRLTAWTAADITRFAQGVLGRALTPEQAATAQRVTSGVPRLVAHGLRASGTGELIDELRAELDLLGEPGQTYLVVAGAGSSRDLELLAVALGQERDDVPAVVARVRAAGLLAADDSVPPVVVRAVRDHVGVNRLLTVLVRMLDVLLAAGQPVLPVARELLRLGATGVVVRTGLEAAAAEVLEDEPALAADLYAAAARGGSSRTRLAPGWAGAAFRSGRLDTALALGDELLNSPAPDDRTRGAVVVGTVVARRGDLAWGAELLRWSGEPAARRLADLAGIALGEAGPGEPDTAVLLPAYGHIAGQLLDGIRESVGGHSETALATLVAAADAAAATGTGHLLPDSPAELAALVALHAAEFDLAHGVLTRAAHGERRTLLLGWTAMLRGDLATATAHRAAVRAQDVRLGPRDELFLRTLELGLARRGDTPNAVHAHWAAAYEATMRQPVDLFTVLPLGELLVAAARMGEDFRVASHRERAVALLERLGSPPLWSTWLHWSTFHAAVLTGDHESARQALHALDGVTGRLAPALSAAGDAWLAVLSGTVDLDAVLAGAEQLHHAGLRWDAARLAGQAAIRATDRTVMVTLLRAAKRFSSGVKGEPAAEGRPDAPALTARERDIGRLVVEGHTYREVGELLHISGKTVEHHMARIRGKLGATDRRTIATLLRAMLGDED
ncbi:helix-turn-helix domain-containing protein [Amycolatopsis saalfeldensis]|uniref:Regulatory protein, luxR family n=1 Tax=Amycolatopsis saalfeldensis TaxID=394193 RepID=A0A1H8YQH5_9PSEU|nr:helix-turn-helix transcriptional regulator [Amycolatopsis saalfeldensis]SEP54251.1 regulatory protein, luxR family [Amycolatopsis saalfeldensis]